MQHMGKKPIFLLRFSALAFVFSIAFGSTGVSYAQKTGQTQANEIKNPGILPISPFYFLKEWRRDIIRSFTRSSLSQAVFELGILDEKISELKKVSELRPDDMRAVEEAMRNYGDSQERLKMIIQNAEIRAEEAKNREKLVDEVLEKMAEHERIMSDISESYKDNEDVRSAVEETRETIFGIVGMSKIIPENAFENIARKHFTEESVAVIIGEVPVLAPASEPVADPDSGVQETDSAQTEQ